jgi:hypothetical protein
VGPKCPFLIRLFRVVLQAYTHPHVADVVAAPRDSYSTSCCPNQMWAALLVALAACAFSAIVGWLLGARSIPARVPTLGTNHPLAATSNQPVGMLHRNCYTGQPDAADPFFTFFSEYKFRWHDAWWSSSERGEEGYRFEVRTFDADAGDAVPPPAAEGTLTFFIVAGMLQQGQTRGDEPPETYTESVALLNSIFMLATGPLELVIATDELGLELYGALFKQVKRTKQQIDVVLMPVREQ